jgi:hypothetical protein
MEHGVDERIDLRQGHAVHRFRRHAGGHRTVVARESAIGLEVQVSVVELPIQVGQRQSSLATFSDDGQHSCGLTHLAHLLATAV